MKKFFESLGSVFGWIFGIAHFVTAILSVLAGIYKVSEEWYMLLIGIAAAGFFIYLGICRIKRNWIFGGYADGASIVFLLIALALLETQIRIWLM